VRGQVVAREPNLVAAPVAVDGEVDQPVAGAAEDVLGHETRGEHPVAPLAGHVVDAVPGEHDVARQQPGAPWGLGHAGSDDGTVLVAITWEEVALEPGHEVGRDVQAPGGGHRLAIQSRTLITAVSVAGLRWLERRETWTAASPSKLLFGAMPSPRAAPSARLRSLRTKSG
jgi:hypothetical protein